ncbi:MAG TPA: DJ-1/PfpI family protein, partial [Thermoanaerobaculia bacterium]|nr:DJ-1/PfpI family protein [Thermoanaerobaculia bacterium]
MADRDRVYFDRLNARLRSVVARIVLCLCVALVAVQASTLLAAPDVAKHWVCPPCGIPCDDAVFDKPGTCPTCGMTLVEQSQVTAASGTRKKVALLVFTGVQIIDFTGPYEIFGTAGFDAYTVGETKDPITTSMGMTVVPKYAFADAPTPDVLVVPGGGIRAALKSDAIKKWIQDTSARTTYTMSVCNGAFLLANAGLLDGLTATTTSGRIDELGHQYPKVKVVHDRRFVDNGKIITTAGLSSGIDGALHVVGKIEGEGEAQQTALYDEYDWRPKSGFARAALADMNIPDVDQDIVGKWKIVKTEGGTDHWTLIARGASDLTAQQISERLGGDLAKA